MWTVMRLLKSTRCLKRSRQQLGKVLLLQSQTVLLKRLNNLTSLQGHIDRRIDQINLEILRQGKISEFNIKDIVEDVKLCGSTSSLQALFLLRICCESIENKSPKLRKELGENIWKTLKELGVPLNVSHYNALLQIYLDTENNFSELNFLNEMTRSNVEPNVVTYQRLVSSACNKKKLNEANKILDIMKNKQIPINEDILSSLIYNHYVSNDKKAMEEIMQEMKKLDITPTEKTYSKLLYAFANKGDIQSIRKTLENCKNCDISLSSKVYLQVIYRLTINDFEQLIDEILESTTKSANDYEREACRIMYDLIEKQKDDVAFKIYQTIPNKKNDHGKFFIQTLINLNVPIEKSIQYCQAMEEMGINQKAFVVAIERSIANDMHESCFALMKAWKDIGGIVKEHYFQKILQIYGQSGDPEGVKEVLQKMILEFNINPSVNLLSTFVLPYISKNANESMFALIDFPIENFIVSNAVFLHLLTTYQLYDVVRYLSLNSSTYKEDQTMQEALLKAFERTEDVSSFVWILHFFYKKSLEKNDNNNFKSKKALDSYVLGVLDLLSKNKYLILMFFENLRNYGLSISPEVANEVIKKLDCNLTPSVKNIINELKSGKLVPKIIRRGRYLNDKLIITSMDIDKLESINLENIDPKTTVASCIKMKAFVYHCCNMNVDKVNEILEDLKQSDQLSAIVYVFLTQLYIKLNETEKAEYWLEEAKKKYPDFRLSKLLNLKLMTSLVDNGQTDKALQYVKSSLPSYVPVTRIIKLLTTVAKRNDADLLRKFFNQLYIHGYITKMSSSILNLFIEFHISRKNGKAAVEEFVRLHETYGTTPYPTVLMSHLIKNKDYESLIKLTKFCVDNFPQSYFHLAIAYLENNDLSMTKSLLEEYCYELYESNLLYYAENYYNNGQIENLEKLFKIMNDLEFDVKCLYPLLLKSYSFRNDWNSVYDLYVKSQNDNVKLPRDFVDSLDNVIKNREFHSENLVKNFQLAVQNRDYKKARESLECLPIIYKSDCYSILCKQYVNISSGYYFSEALDLWRDLYERYNLNINLSTAELILTKLIASKDLMSVELVGNYQTLDFKKQLNYNYYLNKAYLVTGSYHLFLNKLNKQLDNNEITSGKNLNVHYKTAVYALLRYPDLYQRLDNLAEKFSQKNIHNFKYVLWAYNFLQKNNSVADDLWNYVTDPKLFLSINVMHFLNYRNDLDLYVKFSDYVKKSNFNENLKIATYSNIIRSCLESDDSEKHNYCMKCLNNCLNDIPVDRLDVNLLADLQRGFENSKILLSI